MRWLSVVASLALACVLSLAGTSPAAAQQASSPAPSTSASAPAKPATHKKTHHVAKRQPTQKAPTADRISEIQSALSKGGYYQGEANGRWDSSTVAALQKFQSANGIEANGKLDAPTLQKLGLGSGIAGVSAPKPVTSPSCCSAAPATPPSSRTSTPASQPSSSAAATGGPVASANSSAPAPSSDTKSSKQ
jgi:peptidoglycan hydrolase-like protein with peptidoglycan-binding domain